VQRDEERKILGRKDSFGLEEKLAEQVYCVAQKVSYNGSKMRGLIGVQTRA
jgi:hypothetical protein